MKGGRASTDDINGIKYIKEKPDDLDDILKLFGTSKISKTKQTKEEKLYNKIMDNPKISKISKGHLKRNTKDGKNLNLEDLKKFEEIELMMNDSDEEEEPKKGRSKSPISVVQVDKINKKVKPYREQGIMKAKSELVKNKSGKFQVDTEMNIRKNLQPKVKRALKKSVIEEFDKKIKGGRILDLSSDDESERGRPRRGRPKKGLKGIGYNGLDEYDDDITSEEDIQTYGHLLKHLISHIKDPKEKIDEKDYRDAIMLINKIKSKKR